MKDERRLTLTVMETAELLGLSRASAYEGVRNGQIPSLRIGKRILIPRSALEAKLAEVGKGARLGAPR
jgi:excisionase family DNA binding protein